MVDYKSQANNEVLALLVQAESLIKALSPSASKSQELEDIKEVVSRQTKEWQLKLSAIQALSEHPVFIGDEEPFSIAIWRKEDCQRVYINQADNREGWKIIYYLTGNKTKPPGTIDGIGEGQSLTIEEAKWCHQLRNFCNLLCESGSPGFFIRSDHDCSCIELDKEMLKAFRKSLGL